MDLPAPLAWLVDEAGASPGPDRFLAGLGGRLLADGLPLAGGALTLAVPHPALGFAGGPLSQAGLGWLAGLGPVQEDTVGPAPDGSGAGLGRDPAVRPRRGRSVAIGPALRRGTLSHLGRGRRSQRCSRPISMDWRKVT